MKLKFIEKKDNTNLYDDVDLLENSVVKARYWKENGCLWSPDICALPRASTASEIAAQVVAVVDDYDPDIASTLPISKKLAQILKIKNIRSELWFYEELSGLLSGVLIESYKNRHYYTTSHPVEIDDQVFNYVTHSKDLSSSALNVSIIGPAGSGKSTAIDLLTMKYPKIIRHTLGDKAFITVPFVKLTAYAYRNTSALYEQVCIFLDEYLDTGKYHQKRLPKLLGSQTNFVKDLIKLYHIGAFIIDEIEYLTAGSEALNNLLHISSSTGLAIIAVGTEDAVRHFQDRARDDRRFDINKIIINGTEQEPAEDLKKICISCFYYQWGTQKIKPTRAIVKQIMEEASGNIDLLTWIMVMIQRELVLAKKEIDITPEYIHKLCLKKFGKLQALIRSGNSKCSVAYQDTRKEIETAFKEDITNYILKERDAVVSKITTGFSKQEFATVLVESTKDILNIFDGYTETQVRNAIMEAVRRDDSLLTANRRDLAKAGLAILKEPEIIVKKEKVSRKPKEGLIDTDAEAVVQELLAE